MQSYIYLPCKKCVRTRVDVETGEMYQKNIRPPKWFYFREPRWKKIKPSYAQVLMAVGALTPNRH